jgi:hypothetical protein
MAIVITIFGFFAAGFIGWLATSAILGLYEGKRPHFDEEREEANQKQIRNAFGEVSAYGGVIAGLIWVFHHCYNWGSALLKIRRCATFPTVGTVTLVRCICPSWLVPNLLCHCPFHCAIATLLAQRKIAPRQRYFQISFCF